MNDHLQGIIIRCQPYRESDQLATLFTETGCFTLHYRSFHKAGNKQQSFGQLFTFVDVIVDFKTEGIMRVKNGRCIQSFFEFRQLHQWIKYVTIAAELIRFIHEVYEFERLYPYFKLITDTENNYSEFLYFMKQLLEVQGLLPEINQCVRCGKSQVNGFSISQGGFICRECMQKEGIKADLTDINRLKLLRYLIVANTEQFSSIQHLFQESDLLGQILVEYYQYHIGITLKSFEFYKNVL